MEVNDVLETRRLTLRRITLDDAEFILGLLNEPSFLRFIGDKRVRTLDDARAYIRDVPLASYERHGFGLLLTSLRSDRTPIGICGLVKRDALDDADVGYAFLPAHWAQGYAVESAAAVIAHARTALGLKRILGLTKPDNAGSIRVLEKLGLRFDRMVRLSADGEEDKLFVADL